ncbi:N-acetyltransferase [Jiangella sp. DSM 45060]|uniref:GNAT family N-acetyltransferase n=1 Tax=Jiangella sp. DSM 45060 TaxID=1798224 RepID=UPI00087A2979|nr:GNAT family N-acetyltransferase [Jiangella sp. DSM 45060]SDS94162.1 Ribosomal protein S18 acetylase RimI [Jiangella sp. DSM 45060]
MTYRYDLAGDDDAAAIAAVHTLSWRSAYRGHVPDAFLDGDLAGGHLAGWTQRFADRTGTLTVVARDAGGDVVGFAHTMLDHDPELGSLVDNLHVRPDLKRHGIGRRLLAETAARLQDAGAPDRLYLDVIEANEPARNFYVAVGGKEAGRGTESFGEHEVPVLVFAWTSLDALAEPAR